MENQKLYIRLMKKLFNILSIVFGFHQIYSLTKSIIKSPFLCRHDMIYYDTKWVVDPELKSLYRFNGELFKNSLCECKKCGIKKKMSMRVGEFGKWKITDFKTPKNNFVLFELKEIGRETKRQKRERLISKLLYND